MLHLTKYIVNLSFRTHCTGKFCHLACCTVYSLNWTKQLPVAATLPFDKLLMLSKVNLNFSTVQINREIQG